MAGMWNARELRSDETSWSLGGGWWGPEQRSQESPGTAVLQATIWIHEGKKRASQALSIILTGLKAQIVVAVAYHYAFLGDASFCSLPIYQSHSYMYVYIYIYIYIRQ